MSMSYKAFLAILLATVLVGGANAQTVFNYSTDLGSDLDASDPNGQAGQPAVTDCGDMYLEGTTPQRIKDDSATVFPADGDADGDGPNVGHPYSTALQPLPTAIGSGGTAPPDDVYHQYFDLDAEDQLPFEIVVPPQGEVYKVLRGTPGVRFEPTGVYFSYDDDGPRGWYQTPDVPTVVSPDRATEVFQDNGVFWNGANQSWSPITVAGVRDEVALGLAPNPLPIGFDDDVDALDTERFRYQYFSPDHEANMNDDPGSIYMTDLQSPGVNKVQVFDDVTNFGISAEADIDAFEFVSVDEQTYIDIFGEVPQGQVLPGEAILCGLFSVDEDDPDTTSKNDWYGDESGGLNPNAIYITDFLGHHVLMATYDADVDAIATVPEPSTFALALLSLLGLIGWQRRTR